MSANHHYIRPGLMNDERTRSDVLLISTRVVRITVLLSTLAASTATPANIANAGDLRLFEFSSELYMPMGRAHIDGLMASDGSSHRIAIYWAEPGSFRESPFFLRYCDLIVHKGVTHFWIHGLRNAERSLVAVPASQPQLPADDSMESILGSALSIAAWIQSDSPNSRPTLEMGRFFQASRDRTRCAHEFPPDGSAIDDRSTTGVSEVCILNQLPYGRKYSKELANDSVLVWRARKAAPESPVITVRVKSLPSVQGSRCADVFDVATLGVWALIPEAYRAYWHFDHEYSELASSLAPISCLALCHKIETYENDHQPPAAVRRAMQRLRFRTSLLTDDPDHVRRAAQTCVTAFCLDRSISIRQRLTALAEIAGLVEKKYPQHVEEWLRPLVDQVLRCDGDAASVHVERQLLTIEANRWFAYGRLLIEEIRRQGWADTRTLDAWATRLEALRLARQLSPPPSEEETPSVRQYLEQLAVDPPPGDLDMNDIRHILTQVLTKCYRETESESRDRVVENVIAHLRLIVGEGPFRGNGTQIIKSIERFSSVYLEVRKITDPIDTVLATLLGLSFCDVSTREDHEALVMQLGEISLQMQSHVNMMLSQHGLDTLVTPEDVRDIFQKCERLFREYVDDPLWAPFKFPLTENERIRLNHILELCFAQLEPQFVEISLKVKYGGVSEELTRKTVLIISLTAERLLSQTAFLRKPPYPGVSCQYRSGGYGFTAIIRGRLYEEGTGAKERFVAMKYFHLGHRLENIVRQECERTTSPMAQEMNDEERQPQEN